MAVSVSVDADGVVRDDTVRVEVEVDTELEEGGGWKNIDQRSYRIDPRPIRWPIKFELEQSRMIAESFSLRATAYDARDSIVARAQAIRSGKHVVESGLHVQFDSACFRQPSLCSEGMTCHRATCVSARDDLPPSAASDAGPSDSDAAKPSEPGDGVAASGDDCEGDGQRVCAGHGTRQPLQCELGSWIAATECAETERCDTASGDGRGTCKPIASECLNQTVNVPFCDAETMRVCTDLVSSQIRPCGDHRRCAVGPDGAKCQCEPGYVENGSRCVPGTECGADRGGCDPLTQCSMTGGVRTCSECPTGYEGNGIQGCTPLLQGLTLGAGVLEPDFDPSVRAYRIRVPVSVPRLELTARAPAESRVSFDAVEVPNGQPWLSPVLEIGSRGVELRLTTGVGEFTSYALTIDRTAERTYVKPSNSERGDNFGFAVALSGDRFVAGAFLEDSAATTVGGDEGNGRPESGAAYVFVRAGDGWSQEAYLKASDAQDNDNFGQSVAIDGDTIAVGAVRSNILSAPTSSARSGVAYVFTRAGGGWTQQQRIAGSSPRNGDLFGAALALEGDTLAVGAMYGGISDSARGGAVYVFEREGASWTERQMLVPSVASGQFGTSVALDGDRLIVGAPAEDAETGAAYLFERRSGTWKETKRYRPEGIGAGSKFGFSVTLRGDRAAVGAPHHPRNSSSIQVPPGEVYVFERASEGWEQTALLRAPVPRATDFFGASVALSPRGLAIGSNAEASAARSVNGDASNDAAPFAGAAYLFANVGRTSWVSSVYLKPHNAALDACFGYALALGEDMLVVAAPYESALAQGIDSTPGTRSTGAYQSGAVYVFR